MARPSGDGGWGRSIRFGLTHRGHTECDVYWLLNFMCLCSPNLVAWEILVEIHSTSLASLLTRNTRQIRSKMKEASLGRDICTLSHLYQPSYSPHVKCSFPFCIVSRVASCLLLRVWTSLSGSGHEVTRSRGWRRSARTAEPRLRPEWAPGCRTCLQPKS